MIKRMGIIKITFETLEMVLRLPEGHRIVRAMPDEEWKMRNQDDANTILVVIEGEKLPEVHEGAFIPFVIGNLKDKESELEFDLEFEAM